MKRISLPKPLAVPKITRNRRVCRACTTLGSVLLWFSVISLLGQATGACLSCNVPSANISTAIGVNAADHTIAEGLGKRNVAKSPSVIVLSAKPRITSPVHDQIYMGEDVRLTVEPGIEGKRCDLGRYQLVWLRARVETDAPVTLAWTIWSEGPTRITCEDPTVITLPSKLFGNINALYIVNVRYVSEQFKGPWSGGRLFRWTKERILSGGGCRSGM